MAVSFFVDGTRGDGRSNMRRALASSGKGPLVGALDMEMRLTLSISFKCLESLGSTDGLHRAMGTSLIEIDGWLGSIGG
jgi:hypothetical protein